MLYQDCEPSNSQPPTLNETLAPRGSKERPMAIDWFTFFAQILNFVVLIWLMKRFLYGPIIDAMEQRESRIAARLSDAADAEKRAIARELQFKADLESLENTREELQAQAAREIGVWRNDRLSTAEKEVKDERRRWRQALRREKQSLLREIQLNVANHATDLSRHLLMDMASTRLQTLMVDRFLRKVKEAEPDSPELPFGSTAIGGAVVTSSHELSESEQSRIRVAVAGQAAADSDLHFQVIPELICGIELRTDGSKLAWNFRDSLADLEADLLDSLQNSLPDLVVTEAVSP